MTASTASEVTPTSRAPAPLAAVYVFSFLNSIGTAVVTSGIFLITKQGFGFSREQNFLLGVLLGVTYVTAAFGAGRLLRTVQRRTRPISARAVLTALMAGFAALCLIPAASARFLADDAATPTWPIWAMVALYSPLTGLLWPLVESYLSGGRSSKALSRAIGRWNIVWSSAVVLGFWGMGPLIKNHPEAVILALGGLHLLCLPLLAVLPRNPAVHRHDPNHAPHPPVYDKLLAAFRLLLPTSYLISSALNPYLPEAFARLGTAEAWQAALASGWLVPRVVAFALLERWQGWHGRWSMVIVAGCFLFAGFAVAVMAPVFFDGLVGAAVLVAGLFVFGSGMAAVYTGAIYYAMEVGKAEVDAGGTHEGLIGVGYMVGPMLGLAAGAAVKAELIADRNFEHTVLAAVSIIALVVAALVLRRVLRHGRESRAA